MDSDIAEIDGHASTRNALKFQLSELAIFHESLLHSGGSLRAGLCTRCDHGHNLRIVSKRIGSRYQISVWLRADLP